MSVRRLIATTAVTALSATSLAAAAEAPVVSDQHALSGTAVVTVPGTGVQKGEWMGSRQRLVFRDVTLEGGQVARLTLRARRGEHVRGVAVREGGRISFKVIGNRRYAGTRQVTLQAEIAGRSDGEVTDRVYALVRKAR